MKPKCLKPRCVGAEAELKNNPDSSVIPTLVPAGQQGWKLHSDAHRVVVVSSSTVSQTLCRVCGNHLITEAISFEEFLYNSM